MYLTSVQRCRKCAPGRRQFSRIHPDLCFQRLPRGPNLKMSRRPNVCKTNHWAQFGPIEPVKSQTQTKDRVCQVTSGQVLESHSKVDEMTNEHHTYTSDSGAVRIQRQRRTQGSGPPGKNGFTSGTTEIYIQTFTFVYLHRFVHLYMIALWEGVGGHFSGPPVPGRPKPELCPGVPREDCAMWGEGLMMRMMWCCDLQPSPGRVTAEEEGVSSGHRGLSTPSWGWVPAPSEEFR